MTAKAVLFAFALLIRASAIQMATVAQMNTSKAQEDGFVQWGCINTATAQSTYTSEGLTYCQWCAGRVAMTQIPSLEDAARRCREGITNSCYGSCQGDAADLKYVSFEYPSGGSIHIKCWGIRDLEDFRKDDSSCLSMGGSYDYAGGTYPGGGSWTGQVFEITGASSSATGDPHLQNMHGQKFDLMAAGEHNLITIPSGARAGDALLRVDAEARRLGGQCQDIYFQALNVTGAWADETRAGGFRFDAQGAQGEKKPRWSKFGPVELKVVHGRTSEGKKYLNFYVRHLGRAGLAVGGLLGEDDHEAAATPPEGCLRKVSLRKKSADRKGQGAPISVAQASSA